jgi:hypothetical protein
VGDVINLRQARKQKGRAMKAAAADANRAKFGRTKAERSADATEAARRERAVEGHRREKPSEEDNSSTLTRSSPGHENE